VADDEHDKLEELHNLSLIRDKLTKAQKRKLLSTSVQEYALLLSLKADKRAAEARDLEKRNVIELQQLLQER